MLNPGFLRTIVLGLSTIGLITGCGDNSAIGDRTNSAAADANAIQQAVASVAPSQPAITSAANDPVSSDPVAMSDGSVCTPLAPPTSIGPDEAVGTRSCTCVYDLFSLEEPPMCYKLVPIGTWTNPAGGMKRSGSQLDQLPIGTMDFMPMLPSGLDVRAVSTSDFAVSGTDRGVGRVIIAEGADDSLIGGALREQISVTKSLTGTVMERLTDDDGLNDATVVSAIGGDAIVRFPQDGSTAKGRPPIEEVEWIADGVRFSVVIQLGPDAILKGPTFDDSISRFIDSFAPVGIIDSTLQSAPGERRGSDEVSW